MAYRPAGGLWRHVHGVPLFPSGNTADRQAPARTTVRGRGPGAGRPRGSGAFPRQARPLCAERRPSSQWPRRAGGPQHEPLGWPSASPRPPPARARPRLEREPPPDARDVRATGLLALLRLPGRWVPGRRRAAARDAELVWALRHLTDVPRLIGTAVHQAARRVVEAVIAGDPPPSYSAFLAAARFSLNQAWTKSQPAEVDCSWRYPTTYVVLRELALRGAPHECEIEVARMRLRQSLNALLHAPLLQDLRAAAARAPGDVFLPPAGVPLPFSITLTCTTEPRFGEGPGQESEATGWAAVDAADRHSDLRPVAEALAAQAEGDLVAATPVRISLLSNS